MHAVRKPSLVAQRPQETAGSRRREMQSPEQSASATSGTYFKAVRPAAPEPAASARSQSPIADGAKVEGLRFELEVGVWRGDSERIALAVVDDAEYPTDCDYDDE
jgi:hypothetical protein